MAERKTYTDGGKYEILYDLPAGQYSEKEVGGVRTRTIRAGDSLEVEAYPLIRIDAAGKREAKRRSSSKAQEALNLKNARKQIRRLMEHNFTAGDYVLHPTYDYGFVNRDFANMEDVRREWEREGYPTDDTEARRHIKNYIARIRRCIRKLGGDPKAFKYIYVIESKQYSDEDYADLPPRYHFHMVISGMGILTPADLAQLWDWGYIKAEPLDFRFNGLEALAKYITKQRGLMRRWARSKNLKEPEVRVSDRKVSRRRAAAIAADVQANAREILEKIYPGYRLEQAEVKYSDFVAGAYIYARLRRLESGNKTKRRRYLRQWKG